MCSSDLLFVMLSEMLDRKVKIDFLPPGRTVHYEITPYSFMPRIGKRLMGKTYRDFSEGILETICEVHRQLNGGEQSGAAKRKNGSGKEACCRTR